eukprot:CAMPEP_0171964490 /NCGR_PEP_ID=MMETSP0993-20121228/181496_1 /TAXON_ID=483369 /ORGANISM="non described non described, Strain CCMP2098" /LENGTH=247 /DNA_ID=CAMNT_0012613325 /DNA_START=126 /DNA_END=869 /DNA_ORIENTATION=-
MKRILAERTILDFSEIPYATSVCNCILWVAYAIATPGRLFPLLTNVCGLALSLSYCTVFLWYSTGGAFFRVRLRVCGVLGCMGFVVVVAFVLLPALNCPDFIGNGDSSTTDLLGVFAAAFNTGMYGSPLSAMATVMRTRSVEFMPLPLTLGTLGCCISWALYAFYVDDLFIGIPNYVGICLALAQIGLYAIYYKLPAVSKQQDEIGSDDRVYAALVGDIKSGTSSDKVVVVSAVEPNWGESESEGSR